MNLTEMLAKADETTGPQYIEQFEMMRDANRKLKRMMQWSRAVTGLAVFLNATAASCHADQGNYLLFWCFIILGFLMLDSLSKSSKHIAALDFEISLLGLLIRLLQLKQKLKAMDVYFQ